MTSNSDAALKSLSDHIKALEERTKGASLETLEAFREIGQALLDAKEILGNGAFGKWCEAEGFTFSRTWRAKLMKLAENWHEIRQAAAETPDKAHEALTVNGAISVWQAWKRAKEGPKDSGGEGGEGGSSGASSGRQRKSKTAELEEEIQRLREELAKALGEIDRLKKGQAGAANSNDSASRSRRSTSSGSTAGGAQPTQKDKDRFRKVWTLYEKGATDGEKQAAKSRAEDIAKRFGMGADDFARRYGMAA